MYRYKLFSICFVSSLNEGQQLKRSVSAVITAYLNRTHGRRKRREPQTPPCPCSQEQGAVCDLPAPSCQPVAITQLTERQCDKNKRPFYQATLVQFSSVPWLIGSYGCVCVSIRDDSAEILFQSFLQKVLVSSSGMGRKVHSLMFGHLWEPKTNKVCHLVQQNTPPHIACLAILWGTALAVSVIKWPLVCTWFVY